jgi:uncharacterized protein YecT (DUF1311 family)
MNKIWNTTITILLFLLTQSGWTQETTYLKNFPLLGTWKIMSYQIVAYPKLDKIQINNWVGNIIQFREPKIASLQVGSTVKVCADFNHQITHENTEQYFSKAKINPIQLGILIPKIAVVKITCANESWLGSYQNFIKLADNQLISYWDNVVFFLVKQPDDSETKHSPTLLITPQSVGMINPESDFDENALNKALAGEYTFELVTRQDEEGATISDHFKLFQQKRLQLEIYRNLSTMKVSKIRIFDMDALVPMETHLGDVYAKIFTTAMEKQLDCQMGVETEYEGKTLCSFEAMPTIKYVFQAQYLVNNKAISPIEALKQAKLVEWVWIADVNLVDMPAEKESTEVTTTTEPKNTGEVQDKVLTVPTPPTAEMAYKFQEQRLNQLYERLHTILVKKVEANWQPVNTNKESEPKVIAANKDHPISTLLKSQQDWTRYRDNNCVWHAALTNQETERARQTFACLETMTRHRADELEAILKQFKE